MDIPAILQGEVHLPLNQDTTVQHAIDLANSFYQTTLNPKDFKVSVPFVGKDGYLRLNLTPAETDLDGLNQPITFVNKSAPAVEPVASLWSPVAKVSEKHSWLVAPIQLHSEQEMAFLDELGSGNTYSLHGCNTLAFKLATLLNGYEVLGKWMSGTFGELSTAGFELVYKGHSLDVPDAFLVDFSPCLAIIRLHHGERQGYLCLKS